MYLCEHVFIVVDDYYTRQKFQRKKYSNAFFSCVQNIYLSRNNKNNCSWKHRGGYTWTESDIQSLMNSFLYWWIYIIYRRLPMVVNLMFSIQPLKLVSLNYLWAFSLSKVNISMFSILKFRMQRPLFMRASLRRNYIYVMNEGWVKGKGSV